MKKFIDNSVAIVGVLTIMLVTFGITFAWFVLWIYTSAFLQSILIKKD